MEGKRDALEGVRVLSVEQATSGPFCTQILSDLGAEVIKIESPVRGRERQYQWRYKGEDVHFLGLNRNKKSVMVELSTKAGREVFYDLVQKSDALFTNLRPGTPQKLGIDYASLKKVNPRIVVCSLSGYGPTGPVSHRPAFERIIQAMSGMMSIVGDKDKAPILAGWSPVDTSGGMASALGIIAALFAREKTGEGQEVDIAMLDVQMAMLSSAASNYLMSGLIPEPLSSRWPSNPLHGNFAAKDGYMTIAAHRQAFWVKLCQAIGHEELIKDPRFDTSAKRSKNGKELWSVIDPILQSKTLDEWLDLFDKADVPCARINTIDRAFANPQVLHRNMVLTLTDNEGGQIKAVGNPFKLSAARNNPPKYPPAEGQHTDEVLAKVLGYSQEKIGALRAERVI